MTFGIDLRLSPHTAGNVKIYASKPWKDATVTCHRNRLIMMRAATRVTVVLATWKYIGLGTDHSEENCVIFLTKFSTRI